MKEIDGTKVDRIGKKGGTPLAHKGSPAGCYRRKQREKRRCKLSGFEEKEKGRGQRTTIRILSGNCLRQ